MALRSCYRVLMLGTAVETIGQNCLHIMGSGLLGPSSILFQFSWKPENLLPPPQIQG